MVSVSDVYNKLVEVNTNIVQLHTDLQATTNAVNQVKTAVNAVDTDVNNGFATISQELRTLIVLTTDEVKLQYHLTQQADTMICLLDKVARTTCELLNQAAIQTRLQTGLAADTHAVRELTESAHPGAALEAERRAVLRGQIEHCCPPEPDPPACTYKPCPRPDRIKPPEIPRDDQPREPR